MRTLPISKSFICGLTLVMLLSLRVFLSDLSLRHGCPHQISKRLLVLRELQGDILSPAHFKKASQLFLQYEQRPVANSFLLLEIHEYLSRAEQVTLFMTRLWPEVVTTRKHLSHLKLSFEQKTLLKELDEQLVFAAARVESYNSSDEERAVPLKLAGAYKQLVIDSIGLSTAYMR